MLDGINNMVSEWREASLPEKVRTACFATKFTAMLAFGVATAPAYIAYQVAMASLAATMAGPVLAIAGTALVVNDLVSSLMEDKERGSKPASHPTP